jgi:hypothetical protein
MFKKLLYGCALAALTISCNEDFDNWSSPQSNEPEEAVEVVLTSTIDAVEVNLAEVTDDQVKVIDPMVSVPDGFALDSYVGKLMKCSTDDSGAQIVEASYDVDVTTDGCVSVDDLQAAVNAFYGMRPSAREIVLEVYAKVSTSEDKSICLKSNTIASALKVTPVAPVIEPAYYLTGSINGWDNTNTSYKLSNDGSDPYDNPTFTMRIPAPEDGGNIEFKMTPESGLGGDWSECLTAGEEEGTFVYHNAGGNLVITAVEGALFYDVTFNMLDLTWSYTAVNFKPFVYFIGATDGWSVADQKLAHQGDGLYTGYVYCADPNGWGNEFKFQREAGSWDNEINSGTFTGGISGDFADGGGNIKATAGEGVYFVNLDLSALTLNAVRITNMNLVGDFNGWNPGDDAQQMTWDAENFCYVIRAAGVTANGWKFTANNDWGINLGGDLNNLVGNGDNISAVGSIIKLYPTRKTSDNIYCTIE